MQPGPISPSRQRGLGAAMQVSACAVLAELVGTGWVELAVRAAEDCRHELKLVGLELARIRRSKDEEDRGDGSNGFVNGLAQTVSNLFHSLVWVGLMV